MLLKNKTADDRKIEINKKKWDSRADSRIVRRPALKVDYFLCDTVHINVFLMLAA
jgi:hypothetical protein